MEKTDIILDMAIQICNAMKFLEQNKFIHRDLVSTAHMSVHPHVSPVVCLVNMGGEHSHNDLVAGGNRNSEPIMDVDIDSYWGVRLQVAKDVIFLFSFVFLCYVLQKIASLATCSPTS